MGFYTIAAPGMDAVEVEAENWVVALGRALEQRGAVEALTRLACEVLPNGTVLARDIEGGTRYVVQEALLDLVELEDLALGEVLEAIEPFEERLGEIGSASSHVFACQVALEAALEVAPAESGSVILAQDEHLRFMAAVGPFAARLVGVRLPLGTGIAGHSMANRKVLVLNQATEHPHHYDGVDEMTGHETRQMACVPIATDAAVHGVLEVMNLPVGEGITQQQVSQLEAIADALAARLS